VTSGARAPAAAAALFEAVAATTPPQICALF
jgi:hypothetical protein